MLEFTHQGILYRNDRWGITLVRFPPDHPAKEFTIPDDVTEIEDHAFEGCRNLAYLTVPESVEVIGQAAFADVANMTIRFLGYKDIYLGYPYNPPFSSGPYSEVSDVHLIVPRCSPMHGYAVCEELDYRCDDHFTVRKYGNENRSKGQLKCAIEKYTGTDPDVNIPRNADVEMFVEFGHEDEFGTYIPDEISKNAIISYIDQAEAVDYVLPRIAARICDRAFENCETLISVTLPDSMEEIGSKAFAGCTQLLRVVVPASVVQIAPDAFEGCSYVTLEVEKDSYAHRYAIEHSLTTDFQ